MEKIRRIKILLGAHPSKWQYLATCILCLYAFWQVCFETPQLAAFLNASGLSITTSQVFWGGMGIYGFALGKMRYINRRFHLRHEPEVARFNSLSLTRNGMLSNGVTTPADLQAVNGERKEISARLGYLVEQESTYAKLDLFARILQLARRFFNLF
jgi:hypothetical protein